jgi:hypothetical protein
MERELTRNTATKVFGGIGDTFYCLLLTRQALEKSEVL